jgi:hypothetical protein
MNDKLNDLATFSPKKIIPGLFERLLGWPQNTSEFGNEEEHSCQELNPDH